MVGKTRRIVENNASAVGAALAGALYPGVTLFEPPGSQEDYAMFDAAL